jgi:hypothetical protein
LKSAKLALYALPLVTVAVIAFAIFVVGAPRSYTGARVLGGPTEGVSSLSLRVSVVERFAEVEEPADVGDVAVELELGDGRRAAAPGHTDARGMAALNVAIPGAPVSGPIRLRVSAPRARGRTVTLADSRVELSVADWTSRAREIGGWLSGNRKGALMVRVAPGRGVLAVPFASPLWIEVRDANGPVARASLGFETDGIVRSKPDAPVETDALGRASVSVTPREHAVALRVVAKTEAGAEGEWYGSLPVVAGAIEATLTSAGLRIESPIERDVAYWALLAPTSRLAGGPIVLEADGRGHSVAVVPLPSPPPGPAWVVVSGEPELDSASTVGWPLRVPASSSPSASPPIARSVPDRLLADGLGIGFAEEARRRSRARHLALGFTALAALLAVVLLLREGRRAAHVLDEHLREAGAEAEVVDAIAQRKSRWIGAVIALLCIAMGFAIVALVALYRIG